MFITYVCHKARPQTSTPIISLAEGLTKRQKEEAREKLAQLSPEQQSIAIQSFNKAVEGNTAKSPAALMNRLINLGLKNGLETTQMAKPMQTPTQTPKTPAMSDKDYRSARIEVIKALISDPERKERFLNEFKEKGAVYHGAAGGAIMKPDLEAAGLFC